VSPINFVKPVWYYNLVESLELRLSLDKQSAMMAKTRVLQLEYSVEAPMFITLPMANVAPDTTRYFRHLVGCNYFATQTPHER